MDLIENAVSKFETDATIPSLNSLGEAAQVSMAISLKRIADALTIPRTAPPAHDSRWAPAFSPKDFKPKSQLPASQSITVKPASPPLRLV